ncbi:MAG: AAA family ATPase [Actinomycetota bacterium]|nr:AAA family ATPase [Actinomycetota bacterium]
MKIFGKVIIFTGSKGGCGQSFVANCVANYCAIKTNYNILMIDMNAGSKDSRAIYNISKEELMSIADIYSQKKKPSISEIKKIIVNFNNSLSYIFPPLKHQEQFFTYTFLKYLFNLFKGIFDLVIIDCDLFVDFNIKKGSIYDLSDELIIVSLADKVSVSNLNSMIDYFSKGKENLNIKVLINKYNIKPSIPLFNLNSLIRYPISQFLPYDRDIENLYLTKGPASIFKYNLKLINDLSQVAESLIMTIFNDYNN